MTAYEVTQDLLDATNAVHPRAHRQGGLIARRTSGARGFRGEMSRSARERLRAAATGSVAVGALLLAAPVATASAVAAGPSHSAVAQGSNYSTLPSTITLTTRRTGSVIL